MPNLFTRLFGGRSAIAESSRDAATGTETKTARMLLSWRDLGAPDWTRRSFPALAQEGYARNPVVNRCVRLIQAHSEADWQHEVGIEMGE